jgi:hypothetical protein
MQHPFVISQERKLPGQQSDKSKQKKKKSIESRNSFLGALLAVPANIWHQFDVAALPA